MKKIRFFAALYIAKLIQLMLKLLGKNATYFAGKVAVTLCPDFLGYIGKPETLIGVTGTNGKTTVCNILCDFFDKSGEDVLNNRFGSNINAGVATALIDGSDLSGHCKKKIGVLEMDERSARLIYPYVKPNYLICTNLFRDSMRRNAHTEYIATLLSENIPEQTKLVLNADDLISSRIAPRNSRVYFGMERGETEKEGRTNIVSDIVLCPECGAELIYDFRRYNHIGTAHCPNCSFASQPAKYNGRKVDFDKMSMFLCENGSETEYPLITDSLFNVYNMLAAISVLRELGYSHEKILSAFSSMQIVQSRFWSEKIGSRTLSMIMAKGLNSVACSRVFDYVSEQPGKKAIVLMLDDVFDEKDSSENIAWIYDTDYEFLNDEYITQIVVGGIRCLDGKLRLLLAGIPEEKILAIPNESELADSIDYSSCDKVYLLYELYRNNSAVKVRQQIKERLDKI